MSAATVTRLTKDWQGEATAFGQRDLSGTASVYVWVDGIHLKVRLEQDKVCLLVIIGVRADGTKELVALADGFRESSESWGRPAPLLQTPGDARTGARRRRRGGSGRRCATYSRKLPSSAAGGHKMANILACLPKSAHRSAKAALAEIYNAESKDHAVKAAKEFADEFGAKFPKAVAKITDDLDVLLAFYDFPAEHWVHLRTTNPIESTFATVRLRTRVTKGPGSKAAGIAMAFKLIESAQARWRAVNAPHLVAHVRAGAVFEKGKLVERPDEQEGDQQVA